MGRLRAQKRGCKESATTDQRMYVYTYNLGTGSIINIRKDTLKNGTIAH